MVLPLCGNVTEFVDYPRGGGLTIAKEQRGVGYGESGESGKRGGRGNWDWYVYNNNNNITIIIKVLL